MFDAQQYQDAIQPPTFRDQAGRVHVGRVLSVDEWMPHEIAMREAAKVKLWPPLQLAMKQMVRAFFPNPWWRKLLRVCWPPLWGARGRSVEAWVFKLPPVVQMKAVWSFMQSQGKALGVELKAPPGTMMVGEANEVTGDPVGDSPTAT